MKVFCQASALINVDQKVICSGISWLINHQNGDGSFIDNHPVIHKDMMGGVSGSIPMTAFVLIALQECKCDTEKDLTDAKTRAVGYLESQLDQVRVPMATAIVTYALSLSGSELKNVTYEKLRSLEQYDVDTNTLHWGSGRSTQDVEITSYGLLANLQMKDMAKAESVVNWLNSKRLKSGSFPSTQDTVMALQALSQYAIISRAAHVDLESILLVSNDGRFQEIFKFNDDNAMVSQTAKVQKLGGVLHVSTEGQGIGLLSARLKYNIPTPPEKQCKFEVEVNVAEPNRKRATIPPRILDNIEFANDTNLELHLKDLLAFRKRVDNDVVHKKFTRQLQICVKYLGERPAGMTIVDAGILSGFQPVMEDLINLRRSKAHLIQKFVISGRSVIFYLETAPTKPYCFKFHIEREFNVRNTQTSVVKVYDYYSPEESCTTFYSPDQKSPIFQSECNELVCRCAEASCPVEHPFADVLRIEEMEIEEEEDIEGAMRGEIMRIACDEHDYAWIGRVTQKLINSGFLHFKFLVEEVMKEGVERSAALKGTVRELMVRANCRSANLEVNKQYVIMGSDGNAFENKGRRIWYRYMLDKKTRIHEYVGTRSKIQRAFKFVKKILPKDGCLFWK